MLCPIQPHNAPKNWGEMRNTTPFLKTSLFSSMGGDFTDDEVLKGAINECLLSLGDSLEEVDASKLLTMIKVS